MLSSETAFISVCKSKLTYWLIGTIPDVGKLLPPLEHTIL